MAILFSKTPVPGSRAADEDMHAYEAWCRTMGKQPSHEEYLTDSWRTVEKPNTGFSDDEVETINRITEKINRENKRKQDDEPPSKK